jgi:hypothetical protein
MHGEAQQLLAQQLLHARPSWLCCLLMISS